MNCRDPNSVSWSSDIIKIILALLGKSCGKILFLRSCACFLRSAFFFLWFISCFRCFRASFLRNKSGYEMESLFSQKKLLESRDDDDVSVVSSTPDAGSVQTTIVRKMPKNNLATIVIDCGCLEYIWKKNNHKHNYFFEAFWLFKSNSPRHRVLGWF